MDLMGLLPEFYRNSLEVVDLQGAIQPAAQAAQTARNDLIAQLNVATATSGLDVWETALGLKTDPSKSLEFRRTRIMSKLRGQGTTTVAMLKNVSESFSNGAADILEYPAEYRFEIKFVGTWGVPPNMNDLTAAIEEIKPAHLVYAFVYIFRTHGQLAAYTNAQLANYTHEQLREQEEL